MTIIPVAQRNKLNQVVGTFYPLQRAELVALRQSRLINNAAYVHLALRYDHPYCDRPIELIPKEFALEWSIPESSVYEALGKLKQKKIVDIKTGKVVISWANNPEGEILEYEEEPDLEEELLDPRVNSEIPENPPETQNELPDPRNDSNSSENDDSKALPDIDCSSLQTNQTTSNHQIKRTAHNSEVSSESVSSQTREDGEKNEELNIEPPSVSDERCDFEKVSESSSSMTPISDALAQAQDPACDKPSPRVIKTKTELKNNSVDTSEIPQDLLSKLLELDIPLDSKVLKAISKHHISMAYGAAAHVEKTWETIDNPKSVFLYQLPKQPIEQLGCQGKVMTARDFGGFTIEHLKKMYGNKWIEAARHFGVEIE